MTFYNTGNIHQGQGTLDMYFEFTIATSGNILAKSLYITERCE